MYRAVVENMPNNLCLDAIVEKCIQALFFEYGKNPIRYLREIGIQFQLRSILQAALNQEDCFAEIYRKGSKDIFLRPSSRLDRVQLEIRLIGKEKCDLVILRSTSAIDSSPITLTLYSNGALDLVSKIHPKDADAAIEIKAACSADPEQRHKFRKDVYKLLRIAREFPGISANFVLVDKSIGVGEFRVESPHPVHEWYSESKDDIDRWGIKAAKDMWGSYLGLSVTTKPPIDQPFVSIWGFRGGATVRQYVMLQV